MDKKIIDSAICKFPELEIALLSGTPGRGMLRKLIGIDKRDMRILCDKLEEGGVIVAYNGNNTIRATKEAQEYLIHRYRMNKK